MKKPVASTMSFYNDDDSTYNVEEHSEEDQVDSNESHFIQKEPSIQEEPDVPKHILEARKKVYQPAIFIQKAKRGNMFEKKKQERWDYEIEEPDDHINTIDNSGFSNEDDEHFFFQMKATEDKRVCGSKSNFQGWDSEDRLGW